MSKIKLGAVHDHLLFRRGVARILETKKDFEMILEASDGIDSSLIHLLLRQIRKL